MVSCAGDKSAANIITIAWIGVVCSEPTILSVSIRPGRHSYSLIKQTGEFVVNIPGESQLAALDFCGVASGRDVDKFKELGLTAIPASKVSAPLIKVPGKPSEGMTSGNGVPRHVLGERRRCIRMKSNERKRGIDISLRLLFTA
jgi:hypothetical protein